jgi:hypothetical protein
VKAEERSEVAARSERVSETPVRIKLRNGPTYAATEVELDGQRIESAIRGLTLSAHVGYLPTLEVDFAVASDVDVEGEVRWYIPPSTHDALVALGWTPPVAPMDVQCAQTGEARSDDH